MFPVTLEFQDNSIVTVLPPCYGFLKKGNWSSEGGSYYDEDDDEYYDDDSVTYEYNDGSWLMEFYRYSSGNYSSSISRESRSLEEICLGNKYDLSDLKYIWNSGAALPIIGQTTDGKRFAQSYSDGNAPIYKEYEYRPEKDNVAKWAEANKSDLTARAVMEMFEQWIDKDVPSCLVWHEDGFMGVDATAEADRCLFYLMLNRAICTGYEKDAIFQMMDEIQNGCTPMQALIISRLVVKSEHFLTGEQTVTWTGNDYDSCIIPMSLITVGMGKQYAEPIQVNWRQCDYPHSDGHKRDDDYPSIILTSENVQLSVNNSMFMPLLHPSMRDYDYGQTLAAANQLNAVPLFVEFVNQVSNDEKTRLLILFGGGRVTSHPSSHRVMSTFMHNNPAGEKSGYNVRPPLEWIGIIKDLLLL